MKNYHKAFLVFTVLFLLVFLSACETGALPDAPPDTDAPSAYLCCAKWECSWDEPRYFLLDGDGLLEVYGSEADLSLDAFMNDRSEDFTCLFSETLSLEEVQALSEDIATLPPFEKAAEIAEDEWAVTAWIDGETHTYAAGSEENRAYSNLVLRLAELSAQSFSEPELSEDEKTDAIFVAKWFGGGWGGRPKYFLIDSSGLFEVYSNVNNVPLEDFLSDREYNYICLYSEVLSPETLLEIQQTIEALPPFQDAPVMSYDAGYFSFLIDGETYTCGALSRENQEYCDLIDYLTEMSIQVLQ